MVTLQRTLTINAAFLQEIKEDNRELRHLLDDCCDADGAAARGGGRIATGGQQFSASSGTSWRCIFPWKRPTATSTTRSTLPRD